MVFFENRLLPQMVLEFGLVTGEEWGAYQFLLKIWIARIFE
jgi:hypothetical protein